MGCFACGRDLHEECPSSVNQKCCCSRSDIQEKEAESKAGRPLKADDEITTSAGRKRAAVEYKIYPEKPCEWRWQANCGGGKYPITGCIDGFQKDRHHGPVKDTSQNEPTNVHLICSPCHNLWHARNDKEYNEEEYKELPHKPRPATPEEMLAR